MKSRASSRITAKVRQRSKFMPLAILSFTFVLLAALFLLAANARAQTVYPRVGLSASPDYHVDTINVVPGEEFTLYACVFGPGPGEPNDQSFTSLSWVIHQVCCGAEVNINDFDFNTDLEHSGHPLVGVLSTSEVCYSQDLIILATLTCTMTNPTPGGVLWAAGPFDASNDCVGGNALFMGMAVTINVEEDPTPTVDNRWGSIKAMYR